MHTVSSEEGIMGYNEREGNKRGAKGKDRERLRKRQGNVNHLVRSCDKAGDGKENQ